MRVPSISSENPGDAKRIGQNIQDFNKQDWITVNEGIMMDILRVNFSLDSNIDAMLQKTSATKLAEAKAFRSLQLDFLFRIQRS